MSQQNGDWYQIEMKKTEKDLDVLLKKMHPFLNKGEFVFFYSPKIKKEILNDAILLFKETEGTTVILPKTIADNLNIEYTSIFSWITLLVNSSLNAIGFTAKFSSELARHNINCNVIAGYHHDHIFVNKTNSERAIEILKQLSENHK